MLFQKARGDVGRGFRDHETMREGAPLRRIAMGYNVAAAAGESYKPAIRNHPQISRRNHKKFNYNRNQPRPRKVTYNPRQPPRTRRRLAEKRRKPAGPHPLIWPPDRSDLMPPSRGSGRKIIFHDLAASHSRREEDIRSQGPRRRSRRSDLEDHNALLDSAKIKLENIIESFSEKLSSMTLAS